MEQYTPKPFAPPFPDDFDPRSDVYEVVERDASDTLRVLSSSGRLWTVPSIRVAADFHPNPQDRVHGIVETPTKVGFLDRLLGRNSEVAATLRIEALVPNRLELEFAQRWFQSLVKAGLRIDGVDLDNLLVHRLRTAPFGSRTMPPLRKLLRALLEELVGRFPQRDESWDVDEAPDLARALLADLGVRAFEPPAPKRVKHRWHALQPLAIEANRVLQVAGTPLRLVPCEREVFPHTALGEERDYLAELPVWLVLVPTTIPALENANILRRYRGASFPTAPAAADPRALKARTPSSAPTTAVHPIESRPAGTPDLTRPKPGTPPAVTSPGPPKVPCRATIRSFVNVDGTGELVTDEGVSVRFGATSCRDFEPQVGMEIWLIDFGPHPLGKGYRASVLNVSGQSEQARRAEAENAKRLEQARQVRERNLLKRYQLSEKDCDYWKQLVKLTPDSRAALAADLVKLKRESHLFEQLFEDLVTIDAESFHALLGDLDWRAEPEALAWTRAPFERVELADTVLAKSAAIQLRNRVPIGTVGPAHELARRARSPANEIGAAVLMLARSGSPQAISQLTRWLVESRTPVDEVNNLLIVTGWQLHEDRLKQLWGNRPAFHIRKTSDGPGSLYESSASTCPACKTTLLCLLRDSTSQVIPFSLFTCVNCAPGDIKPYYVEVDSDGVPHALVVQDLDVGYDPLCQRT